MKLSPFLLIAIFFIVCFSITAQIDGQVNFSSDSLLIKKIVENRVASVRETINKSGVPPTTGTIYFDTMGRVTQLTYPFRLKMEYDAKGNVVKTAGYNSIDTNKIDYWFKREYDEKGRCLKVENGQYENGQLITGTISATKIIKDEKDLTIFEVYQYSGGKKVATMYIRDSTSGIYRFESNASFTSYAAFYGLPDDGGQLTKKTLSRKYVIDNCYYEDMADYGAGEQLESVINFEAKYTQRDAKLRLIEIGTIDLSADYEKYLKAHPKEAENVFLPPNFIKSYFKGTVPGKRVANTTYTYDAKGLLKEKKDYGSIYKYKYNEKDQLTEFIAEGYYAYTIQYWYNEKGLVNKFHATPAKQQSGGKPIEENECTYVYSYY